MLFRGKVREFGWRLGEAKYLLWGYAIPWLYGLVIYGTVWVTGLGGAKGVLPMLDTVLRGLCLVGFVVGAVGMTGCDPIPYPVPTTQILGGEDEH